MPEECSHRKFPLESSSLVSAELDPKSFKNGAFSLRLEPSVWSALALQGGRAFGALLIEGSIRHPNGRRDLRSVLNYELAQYRQPGSNDSNINGNIDINIYRIGGTNRYGATDIGNDTRSQREVLHCVLARTQWLMKRPLRSRAESLRRRGALNTIRIVASLNAANRPHCSTMLMRTKR